MALMERTGSVNLTVPADYGYLRLIRLAIATLASDLPFELDEVESARAAADELVTLLIASTDAHELVSLSICRDHDSLTATGSVPVVGEPLPPSPVVRAVLDSTTTVWECIADDDALRFSYTCRTGHIGTAGDY